MTIDERIERLEHVTAAHIEQAKKDYEENRRIWREHQTEVSAIWRRMEERDREFDRQMALMRKEAAERDRKTDEQIRETDKRIADLVSAIGTLIGKL